MVRRSSAGNHWWWFNFEPEVFNSTVKAPMEVPVPKSKDLGIHDWGPFGEYEYLGAGTRYRAKQKARIRPVSDLDRIAESHDMWYAMSADTGGMRSGYRGLADYGAGAAMMTAAFNPWSDLDAKGRVLAFLAGDVLMIQGLLRLNPATWMGMRMLDKLFY